MTDLERENAVEEFGYRWRSLRGYARAHLWRFLLRDLRWILLCWCPRPYWCVEYDGRWCAFDHKADAETEVREFHEEGCCWPKRGDDQTPDCAPIPTGRVCGSMGIEVKWMSPLRVASYGEFDGW